MQLLELSANQETFKTVTFNKTGINLIIGQKSEGAGIKDTYNGVGKSLLIELINFCLGSNKKKSFEESLPKWEFTLKFLFNEKTYTVTRSTINQNSVVLNGNIINLTKYTKKFGEEIFYLEDDIKFLKFRGLMSYFIRSGKQGYSSFRGSDKNPYETNLKLSYLLGLDYNLAIRKHELKTEIDNLNKSKKLFEENEVLKNYYFDEIDIDLADLEEQIQQIEVSIKHFKVADDYHEIRKEADLISSEIKELANKEFTIKHTIRNIQNSLKIEPDLDQQHVLKLYEQAHLEVADMIKRKLDETMSFHDSLLSARTIRLTKECKKFQNNLLKMQRQRQLLTKKEVNLLKYLSSKGALEEYTALNMRLSDLRQKREKLTQYSKFLETFDRKKAELKNQQTEESLGTEKYLSSNSGKKTKEKNLKIFQKLARVFYNNKPSGISVHNNDGNNQTRYDIHVKIQQDQSDGIDEVKIFCFDWMLLLSKHNHKMNMLVHDSRLFSNMDPRQQATALRVAGEYTRNENCQYIATFNANMLEGIKNELMQYNYDNVFNEIEKSIILKLTDESESTKLLGINIDLDYEK